MILIQARSTSKRFPNKMMATLDGEPLIHHAYNRCKGVGPTMFVIPEKDNLAGYLRSKHIPFYEGPKDDVLARYYGCAKSFGMKWIIRITGDCPLLDTQALFAIMTMGKNGNVDFISNCVGDCVNGWEVELMSFRCLEWAHKNANGIHREHVTTFIKAGLDFMTGLRMTKAIVHNPYKKKWFPKMSIDTKEDLANMETLIKELKGENT